MKKNRFRWLFLLIIVLAVALSGGAYLRARGASKGKPIINTGKVMRGDVTTTISATGVLEPLSTVDVKSNVGGQIVFLGVDAGDKVKAGQLIARIDPADSQTNLDQQQANLSAVQSKVAQAEEQRTIQLQQNMAQVRSSEQALETSKLKLSQAIEQAGLQKLVTDPSITQAEQALEAAKARLDQAQEQARIQPALTDAGIKQARSNLDSARAALKQTKEVLIPQKLSGAQEDFNQANENFSFATKDLNRQKNLLAKGFVAASVVESAEQRLATAKAQLGNARQKLDTVKRDTDEDLNVAQARVDQMEAALNTQEANRAQDVLKQKDVVAAQAAVKQAEAALKTARANRAQVTVKNQDVAAARAAVKQAEATLSSARANLAQDKMRAGDILQARAQVTQSSASLKNAITQLGYTTITAPSGGIVMTKYVELGTIVTGARSSGLSTGAGVSIVQIADTSRMFAQVTVDETDIAQVSVGQAVDITIDAYPDELFDGKVTKIAPAAQVNQNVTTIPVTVEIDMPDGRLKPGMNASCEFITNKRGNVLMVPNAAVKDSDGGATVQVMENGVAVARKVEVGLVGNNNTEVISGLKEGEEVVTSIIDPSKAKAPSGQSGGGQRGGMRMMPPPM